MCYANFLVPKPKPRWNENRVRRGPPVLTLVLLIKKTNNTSTINLNFSSSVLEPLLAWIAIYAGINHPKYQRRLGLS